MSAIKKAAEMLRREAESIKECHTVGVGGEWYGESAKTEYEKMIAAAAAAVAERDECNRRRLEAADHFAAQTALMKKKYDALRAAVRHEADCVEAAKAEIKALRSELVDLRSSMAFRTSLVGRTEAERDALRAKLEAAESDAAHQEALADSALRVAEGWEEKCKALRAKITEMEQQEPVAYMPLVTVAQLESGGSGVVWCPHDRSVSDVPVYALPGAKGEGK